MFLVDTSVWIHALRPGGHASIKAHLKPLIVAGETAITDWIVLELATGLSKGERLETLLEWFAPVERLPFNATWWETASGYAAGLRKSGVSPTAADCLIATVAVQHKVPLIHCDADFEIMKPAIPLKTVDWTIYLKLKRQD